MAGAKKIFTIRDRGQDHTLLVLRENTDPEQVRMFGAPLLADLINVRFKLDKKKSSDRVTLISNPLANADYAEGNPWENLRFGLGFTVSDGIAYRKAGDKFGAVIISDHQNEQPVIVPVPESVGGYLHLRDEVNLALVMRGVTSQDILVDESTTLFEYAMKKIPMKQLMTMDIDTLTGMVNDTVASVRQFTFATNKFVEQNRLVVQPYPGTRGTGHMLHKETGVPTGPEAHYWGARANYRYEEANAALLVHISYLSRTPRADYLPSYCFGVLAKVPEGAAAEFEAFVKK